MVDVSLGDFVKCKDGKVGKILRIYPKYYVLDDFVMISQSDVETRLNEFRIGDLVTDGEHRHTIKNVKWEDNQIWYLVVDLWFMQGVLEGVLE